jgi:anti-sigma-K factor RskA
MNTEDNPRLNSGAFALGALSPEERERFLTAVAEDPDLAAESDELSDTAVLLGLAAAPVQPLARLKIDLMAAIASTPQLPAQETASPHDSLVSGSAAPPLSDTVLDAQAPVATSGAASAAGPAEQRARGRWFTRPATLLAAAAAAIALFVGGGIVGSTVFGGAPAVVDNQAAGLAEILAASDAQQARSDVEGGGTATLVWSGELGRSAVVVDGLAPLPAGSVYEAWYINDAGAAPAGTFDATGAHKASWHLLDGTMSAGDTVGVTVEPAGGSKTPTTTPIVAIASGA